MLFDDHIHNRYGHQSHILYNENTGELALWAIFLTLNCLFPFYFIAWYQRNYNK